MAPVDSEKVTGNRQQAAGSPSPLASIVVLNWNGRPLLERYFGLVVERTLAGDPEHELILVDNGSSDGSVDWVRAHHPQVRVIALAENTGFSHGNNTGAREAKHPILVFLNNDVEPMPGFLAPALAHFTDPDVFAVAMKSLVPSEGMAEEAVKRLVLKRGWFATRDDPRIPASGGQAIPVLYACGGMVAVDRVRFLALGGFDEMFSPFYWEDVELSLAAARRDWLVLYEPASVVHHQRSASTGRVELRGLTREMALKNHHLLIWKHLDGRGRWAAYLFWTTLRMAKALVTADWLFLRAMGRALTQLPEALAGRRREQREARQTASAVLQRYEALG